MVKSILKRGFKANAEKLAVKYREELKIHACGPLCGFRLAEHLGVPVFKAAEFITLPHEIALLSGANGADCGWSALTMLTKAGNRIIIHNQYHSIARQQSDIMHELAHIICKHERAQTSYDFQIPIGMRDFNEEQEEEAKCLGAALQISRPGLLWAIKKDMKAEEIAQYFNASIDMVKYRMNTTGVVKQVYYKKGK